MPRVVPSDVVHSIEQLFPGIIEDPRSDPAFSVEVLPAFQAIISLVDAVPGELLQLDPAEFANLTTCVAVLRGASDMLTSVKSPALFPLGLRGFASHPIAVIHEALARCPDEAPSPLTTELTFIHDMALRDSVRLDISAANHDLEQGEWKGATVLGGSAVEALLLWAIQEHERVHPGAIAVAGQARLASGALRRRPDADPEKWVLHEYIEVAEELGLVEAATATQARQAQDFRNLIHPGRAARIGQKCDRGTALAALAAVEFVVRDLTP